MIKKMILYFSLILMCLSIIIFGLILKKPNNQKKDLLVNSSKTIYDTAESTTVMDTKTKRVLYEKQNTKRLLPASTCKILTCLVAIENYDLDDFVIITKEMVNTTGSAIYLEVGDVISINDLLYGLMLCSGNDAALALAYHYSGTLDDFVYLMNQKAKAIGMQNSTFENPTGLDEVTKNYTTTYDMALLMSYALENATFRKITSTKSYQPKIISGKQMFFKHKHKLLNQNSFVTSGKTGYTKKAGRTLVTSFKDQDLEIVVVSFNCPDDWHLHENLFNFVKTNYQPTKLVNKFMVLFKTLNKHDYRFTNDDLLIPLKKDEKEVVSYQIIEDEEGLTINYYLDEKLIGYVLIKPFSYKKYE